MKKYNWCDVRDLADRLRPTFKPDDRAEEDGPQIRRNNAMWRYNVNIITFFVSAYNDKARIRVQLKDCQIDRVKPTQIDNDVTYYNEKDVKVCYLCVTTKVHS